MSEDGEGAESLAALTRFLVGDASVDETLTRVAGLAVKAIPAAAFAGLSIMVENRVQTAVFTDLTSPEIDQAQYDVGDGPCLEAFRSGEPTEITSTVEEGRWPEFRRAAAAHGVLSTLSLPMIVEDRSVGALNLYSGAEAAFGQRDRELAGRFAADAAVVLANAQAYWDARDLSVNLGVALESRAVI